MQLLGSQVEFRKNIIFSFRRYRVWWIILFVTALFDYLTTLNFIAQAGPEAEANSLIKWLIINLGAYAGVFVGKSLQLIAVVMVVGLSRLVGNLFLLVVILLNCWAVVMNTVPYYL